MNRLTTKIVEELDTDFIGMPYIDVDDFDELKDVIEMLEINDLYFEDLFIDRLHQFEKLFKHRCKLLITFDGDFEDLDDDELIGCITDIKVLFIKFNDLTYEEGCLFFGGLFGDYFEQCYNNQDWFYLK